MDTPQGRLPGRYIDRKIRYGLAKTLADATVPLLLHNIPSPCARTNYRQVSREVHRRKIRYGLANTLADATVPLLLHNISSPCAGTNYGQVSWEKYR